MRALSITISSMEGSMRCTDINTGSGPDHDAGTGTQQAGQSTGPVREGSQCT